MVRFYGKKPYTIAVIHGGPGARGTVAGIARGLEKDYGSIEPIQSKDTIQELVEELKQQLTNHCDTPVTLIGHSWGAWLVGIFAEKNSNLVKKVILIGSGPLEEIYTNEINKRRMGNMTKEDREEYIEILQALEDDNVNNKQDYIGRLGKLCANADDYERMELESDQLDKLAVDEQAYEKIWPEAAKLRQSGELMKIFSNIKSPIVLIQGKEDSHPYVGVTKPLSEQGIPLKSIILEKCGHTPWKEKYARKEFFDALIHEL